MPTDMSASLPLIVLGLVAFVLAVWVLARLNRKAKVIEDDGAPKIGRDVLDEGAERAQRNQALIDSPRAIEIIQGPLSAAANSQQVAAASMDTDAEAGPQTSSAPVPTPTPTPSPAAEPAPAPQGLGSGDDITRIKGLGPKLAAVLGELGVTTFAQIAAWSDADVERIDAQLGRFKGRITRDQWIAQAQLLAAGDESGFVAKFGSNG